MDDNTEGSVSSKPSSEVLLEGPAGADSRPSGDEQQLNSVDDKQATVSKSQLKKIKKKEKWNQVKAEKRKKEKERAKARKRELREKGELGPTRKQLRHNTMKKSDCKIQVAIDCAFDEFMSEKDIKMLVKQIQFSYSANRRALSPLQFYCCGIGGKTKERLESLGDYKGWDINFQEESYENLFDKSSIVYLSSESPNVLHTLEENKVYIIGGLVDHNHQKGLCHRLAVEKGLQHAQLPITEFLDMKTRKVFTINHVFGILLHYTETKDWQKAFHMVIPPRKGAVLKRVGDSEDKDEGGDSGNGDNCDIDSDNVEDKDDSEIKQDFSSDTSEKDSQVENDKEKGLFENKTDKSECKVGTVVEEEVVNRTNSDENEKSKQGELREIDGVTDSTAVSHEPDLKYTDSDR